MAREARALTAQIAQGNQELRRLAIEAKRDADADKKATAATAKAEKPVPTPVMKILSGLEQQAEGLSNVNRSYKPAYAGGWGAFDRLSGTWNPFSGKESEAAASWWKDYENQAALVERHEKFGTALSAGEQAAWKNATIAPGMKDAVIAENLKTRAGIAEKIFEKSRGEFIRGGYPMVDQAFPSRSTKDAPTQAEVDKMPRGTKFIGSDGKEYVKD
jgi:hypothetical protein